ncbi:MAG: tRNA 2-thiouridine(34) synthase MnmA [Pseudomonadales bacterium]
MTNPTRNAVVVVGLSGGVDSAVAAKLLRDQGYTVKGLFMKNWDEDDGTELCTAIQDFEDAQQVAETIGIELLTANFAAEYWERVFEEFLAEYQNARTPNPDILCNREIKFDLFVRYAHQIGADTVATGHYARVTSHHGSFELHKARDLDKDQTYFLQGVPRDRLAHVLFPLSHLYKKDVRRIARNAGFAVHEKKDSTGICFIGERRFTDFLSRYIKSEPGPIVDKHGEEIGQHDGLPFFTLGQRQGLGIGGRRGADQAPWYVMNKLPETNTLVVTQREEDLMTHSLLATNANWLIDMPESHASCTAKTRYGQPDQRCRFRINGTQVEVSFDLAQRAVTPGQYIAFYDKSQCIGGAQIESTLAGTGTYD